MQLETNMVYKKLININNVYNLFAFDIHFF